MSQLVDALAPLPPCIACGGTRFWRRGEDWVCDVCHPNPRPEGTLTMGEFRAAVELLARENEPR